MKKIIIELENIPEELLEKVMFSIAEMLDKMNVDESLITSTTETEESENGK